MESELSKIPNPFDGWTEDQQCIGYFAINYKGEDVGTKSFDACQWCAEGRLSVKNVPSDIRYKFSAWLHKTTGEGIMGLNDIRQWTPAQFKAAWDKFVAEREVKP